LATGCSHNVSLGGKYQGFALDKPPLGCCIVDQPLIVGAQIGGIQNRAGSIGKKKKSCFEASELAA
jgi:pyrimidine deaminase RibD-like protein